MIIGFYFFFSFSSILSSSKLSIILCSKPVVFRKPASRIFASIFLSYPEKIAIPTKINITQRIFLKTPFGSLAHFKFFINFCPNIAIASKMAASQSIYDIRETIPITIPAGRIIARISAYVGLQLLNTGPSASPIRTYFILPFFAVLLLRSLFELSENQSLVESVFQRFGNRVIIPSPMIRPPEKLFQNDGGTSIKIVEAFKRRENISIDILKDAIIIYGVYLFLSSSTLAHRMIGKIGSTHGARTVKTPDKNAIIISVIIL